MRYYFFEKVEEDIFIILLKKIINRMNKNLKNTSNVTILFSFSK